MGLGKSTHMSTVIFALRLLFPLYISRMANSFYISKNINIYHIIVEYAL